MLGKSIPIIHAHTLAHQEEYPAEGYKPRRQMSDSTLSDSDATTTPRPTAAKSSATPPKSMIINLEESELPSADRKRQLEAQIHNLRAQSHPYTLFCKLVSVNRPIVK